MIDPKTFAKSDLLSRVALGLALLIAGTFGLAIAFLVPPRMAENHAESKVGKAAEQAPVAVSSPLRDLPVLAIDHEALAEFCSANVTERRSFVIFRGGTCVVVDEPCVDPVGDARARLEACNEADARFVPERTREGNLIVSFREPVFLNFSAGEIEQLGGGLETVAPLLLTPDERATAGPDWMPPTTARLGLLARRRMLEDAAKPVPVRIIRARERATAATEVEPTEG